MALKEIYEIKLNVDNKGLDALFEESFFEKLKSFKSIFEDEKEKFVLLLNTFIQIIIKSIRVSNSFWISSCIYFEEVLQ